MEDGASVPLATVDAEMDSEGEALDQTDMATLPVEADEPLAPADNQTVGTPTLEDGLSALKVDHQEINSRTSCFIILSFVYAKLLVVVCIAFLISEVITNNVPLYFYEVFFTYLYGVSILFLLYVFCYLLQESSKKIKKRNKEPKKSKKGSGLFQKVNKGEVEVTDGGSPSKEKLTIKEPRPRKTKTSDNEHSHGSFFLRIGAIAFGLGTMIYNGLELGTFFEIPFESQCWQILRGINPCLQAMFTFMQMYFIFMNARLNIQKFKCFARFGLMHIVATNLCVWLRTLVRETMKEIYETSEESNSNYSEDLLIIADSESPANMSCNKVNIMGTIVEDSSPYLYPFLIEYSLIGASVVYIMWRHIGRNPRYLEEDDIPDQMSVASRKPHTKVDCIGVSKGLFLGLLVLAACLICLILFFVFVNNHDLNLLAIYLADTSHAGVLFLSILAMAIGFVRIQKLKFMPDREDELDTILLRVSAFGLFLYSVFTVIAASLSPMHDIENLLVLITGCLAVLQVVIQLLFIADVSKRQVFRMEHDQTKPGRQIVTFLLIVNLTLWIVYTFEMQKVSANPVQEEFYSPLPWAIMLRFTLPLSIFHRFHAAVVLAEVWKGSYKARGD